MMHTIINADCLSYLHRHGGHWDTIFADPPDNIGAKYISYKDSVSKVKYVRMLRFWMYAFVDAAFTVWFSYNSRWNFEVGSIVKDMLNQFDDLEAKLCVQTFTFGQHNKRDLGNNFRPLLRLRHSRAPLLPEAIRIPSWRQLHGDKRANPEGRVPGDVFDFPRVTGNSKQRRKWHPTQLNEGLIERCIRLTTPPGGEVLDPFGGTGTTLRVCERTYNPCTLIEIDADYCAKIAGEHGMNRINGHEGPWTLDQPSCWG